MAVFLFELARTTRRGRVVLLRVVYALALLAVLCGVFLRGFPGRLGLEAVFALDQPEVQTRLAQFAAQFAAACLLVQFAAVLLLTPALTAGAIAGERQRGTLDPLLTTALGELELVLGKLAARLAMLVGVLLTGLPVLALTPLWGSVEPRLVLAGTALSVLTLLSLGGLGMLCSALCRNTLEAVVATYAAAAALACLATVPGLRLANPAYVMSEALGPVAGQPVVGLWLRLVLGYATWHLVLFVGGTLGAAAVLRVRVQRAKRKRRPEEFADPAVLAAERLAEARRLLGPNRPRPRPLRPPSTGPRRRSGRVRAVPPPPGGRDALLWRELHFAGGAAAGELWRVIGAALIGVALTVGLKSGAALLGPRPARGPTVEEVNPTARGLTTALLTTVGIGTLLRAAAGVGGERQRRTLDVLLTLPAGRDGILRAKWLGSVARGRWLMAAVAGLWLACAAAGSLHPLALVWLAVAAAAHLVGFAGLGLYLSVATRGPGRAMVYALAALLAVWLLPLVASSYLHGLAAPVARDHPWLVAWLEEGLVPPVSWWHLAFPAGSAGGPPPDERVGGVTLGLATYALAGWLLWHLARRRFRREQWR